MEKHRLESFSDNVISIILTIMVLELKVPHGTDLAALANLLPVFVAYVLSFVFIGIYWNNHHHMLHVVHRIDGPVLWANLYLLFWLSILPFVTGWMSENHFARYPVALYGFVLLMAAAAYTLLARILMRKSLKNPELFAAIGTDMKGIVSLLLYLGGMGLTFIHPFLGIAIYFVVAMIWLVPDRRIEKNLHN